MAERLHNAHGLLALGVGIEHIYRKHRPLQRLQLLVGDHLQHGAVFVGRELARLENFADLCAVGASDIINVSLAAEAVAEHFVELDGKAAAGEKQRAFFYVVRFRFGSGAVVVVHKIPLGKIVVGDMADQPHPVQVEDVNSQTAADDALNQSETSRNQHRLVRVGALGDQVQKIPDIVIVLRIGAQVHLLGMKLLPHHTDIIFTFFPARGHQLHHRLHFRVEGARDIDIFDGFQFVDKIDGQLVNKKGSVDYRHIIATEISCHANTPCI